MTKCYTQASNGNEDKNLQNADNDVLKQYPENKTGWNLIDGKWYHLRNSGAMDTGWFKDNNGKWYYLNNSGKMVKNTSINGYKLGNDGTWIKS